MPSFLRHRLTPSGIALLYAGFAALWITASDGLLNLLNGDQTLLVWMNVIKGLAFVAVTAGLLYLLLQGWHESIVGEGANDTAALHPQRRYWIVTLLGLAVLPLLGFGIVYLHGPQLEREAYANLQAIADLKADQITRWLIEQQRDAEVLATDAGFARQVDQIRHRDDATLREEISARLDGLRTAYDYEGVVLLDAQGQPVIAQGHHSVISPRLTPLLTQALAANQIRRSDLYLDETGQIHLDWIVPVTVMALEGRRPVAAVVFHMGPNRLLFPLIQHWPTASPSAESLLVRRDGDSVLFLNELRHQPGPALTRRESVSKTDLPAAIAVRTGQAGTMQGVDYRGIPVFAAFRPVADTGWQLIAKIDRAEVMAPLYRLVFWVSLVALFAVAAITAAVLGLWRQQQRTHRFELLAQAAEQDQLLRQFYDLPFIGMALTSPETKRWLQFNDRLCEILGYSREELTKLTWAEITHPDDLNADVAEFNQVLHGESEGYVMDKRFIRPDGTEVFTTINVKCVRRTDGTVKIFIATINDITERQRAAAQISRLNRIHQMLSNINQIIVRRNDPASMMNEACQIAVRDGGFRMAWIGRLNPETGQVRPMAQAGYTDDYPEQARITLVGPRSEGPDGTALRSGRTVACNDIAADPTMVLWREAALALGYRASIALPLAVRGAVWGILNLYADQVGFFDVGEIVLLEELASDIAFALEVAETDTARLETEQALHESQERFRRAVEEAPFPIMIYAEDGEVLALSRAWTEISGYTRADIPTMTDWTGLAYGERQQAVQADIDQLYNLQQRKAEGEYRITCKDGSQRDWEFSSVAIGRLADHRRIAISMAADVTERNWATAALRRREQQYRVLFEANPHPMWVHDLETLRFLAVNDAAIRHYGFSRPEFLAMTIADIRPPEEIPRLLENIAQLQNNHVDEAGIWKHRKKDGALIDVEITSHILEFAGRRAEVVLAHDVTERLRIEERLRQAATVFENTREGITITDADERILRVNRAFCELTGYTEEEVQGQTPRLLHSGRQSPEFYAALWASVRDTGHWQGEIWNRRKNGEVYPELLSISAVRNTAGIVTHYVGVFADLSQIKASEEQLDFLAHHDPLTGLPNRLLLSARLQHSIGVAHRDGGTLALLVLDLDRFKDVNDSYGHSAGDALLQQVAERLTNRVRGADTVTRLGGDEFAVLLENLAQPQDAARVAMEVIGILSEPWQLGNDAEVRLGASLGISLFPDHGQTAEDLLQQADAALYQAKSEGRGRFQYFSADLTQAARRRIELEARLRRAITDQQLRVYYQPQIDIPSGRIVGAEALVRWQDPERGLIPPGHFVPVAEETGLISAMGEWVLRETCRQGQEWRDAGLPPLTLAVNLSAHQLHHGDLAATVLQVLNDTGFPAEWLELELTESALMLRETEAVTILERLRGLGLHLAMDDFGTGYSSLAYLRRFPLDVLKIDKSFVDDLPHQREAMEIAATIIAMGHTLGLKVLAEGVETPEQLAFLQRKGCDRYQGYLTSPPVPAAAFVALLTRMATGAR